MLSKAQKGFISVLAHNVLKQQQFLVSSKTKYIITRNRHRPFVKHKLVSCFKNSVR